MAMPMDLALLQKKQKLWERLSAFPSVAIAFSGGVDSTLLLATAVKVLGGRVVAMTARSATHPTAESDAAASIARRIGVKLIMFDTPELDDPGFVANGPRRCYHCKKILFTSMRQHAADQNISLLAHGANVDDLSDFRPGFEAAEELGVQAPLIFAGLTKSDIRTLARDMHLPNWNRPAMACLATRIPYGVEIRSDILHQIAHAEAVLSRHGFNSCRVRHHGLLARIEIDAAQMDRLLNETTRREVVRALRESGYEFVALDLEGYVSGKMNRGISS